MNELGLQNSNIKYLAPKRELSSVFAELEKTSVSQAENFVDVKASKSPHLTKVLIALSVAVVLTVVCSAVVVTVVVLNNNGNKEDKTDTTTAPPVTLPQVTDVPSSRTTDTTTSRTTSITSTDPGADIWSGWGEWTQCTATCNNGIHTRYRQCNAEDSTRCVGDYVETGICMETTCPIYGMWTTWGSWASCDVSCGGGIQSRSRTCTKADTSDLECVGGSAQSRTCADWECPDCNTVCTTGILNTDCDSCVCDGDATTGRILAQTTGSPISNAALYPASAPTKLLAVSNSTGYFSLDDICTNTELIVSREGFVDTEVIASSNNLEISMAKIVFPYLTETPQSKYRLSGENVTMCCQAEANPTIDYFEWLKDGNLLDQTLFQSGNTLTLTNVSSASSGKYKCRANSVSGAIMSSAATLNVKDHSDDFCVDALQQKTITLPDDCVQTATNTATYEVGECLSKKCRETDSADSGLCREDISSCCITGEAILETIQCSGYELQVIVVRSCICGTCMPSSFTISGTALGLEDRSPLKFGEVWANGVFKSYTNINGDFSFDISNTLPKVTLNLKDTYFKQFLQATKVVDVSGDIHGVLRVDIMVIKAAEPVEIDSTVENTLVAGTSLGDTDTPIVQISIPANAFYYSDGTQYNGIVEASLTFLDPTNTSILGSIPGVFEFIDEEGQTGNLASLGVFNLYFEDTSGQPLVLDEVIDLYTPAVAAGEDTNQNIKLWRMNSDTGVWEYVAPGTGNRRRKRRITATWVGEIDWATVDSQIWWNYDKVYRLTDNPCYFKVRLFKDSSFSEPVSNPNRYISVEYHIFNQNVLRTIYDSIYYPDNECVIGICENDIAYISLFYYGFIGYEILYASETQNVPSSHYYNVTDGEKVLKIEMTGSSDGPFYQNETQCLVSSANDFHLRYHYGKTYEGYIFNEIFASDFSIGIATNEYISKRTWYPMRTEGVRACFIKVKVSFDENVQLSPGQYIKLKVVSYGGTYSDIQDFVLGIKEVSIENTTANTTVCIEYKCSGKMNTMFTPTIDYTKVVLSLTYPTSDILSEVIDESDFVTGDLTGLNVEQVGNIGGTYIVYPPLVYSPELGIYSLTNSEADTEAAKTISRTECQSGEPQNHIDNNPDLGVAVTFKLSRNCYHWWWCG